MTKKNHPFTWLILLLTLTALACSLALPGAATPIPTPLPTATALPLPPVITETIPPQGSLLPLVAPISVYFSEAMDPASVQAAYQSQEMPNPLFTWLDASTLNITPTQPLPPDADVNFQINTSAKTARTGLTLPQAQTFTYRTAGMLKVSQVLPAPQAQQVSPASAIVVSFNQPVVPLGADSANLPAGFSLLPAASGKGEWLNTSAYIFYPQPSLAGGETYTVQVNPALQSIAGTGLDSQSPNLAWSFSTSLPEVLSISPASEFLAPEAEVSITFNQPMDKASVEAQFALRGQEGNPTPGEFTWNESGEVLTFRASAALPRAANASLFLGQNARSLGGAPLTADTLRQYRTYDNFAFYGADIANGAVRPANGAITLYFSAPPQQPDQGYESLITVSPQPSYFNISASGTELSAYGQFSAGQTYTLRIDPNLADEWGQSLGQPQTLTFTEADAVPSFGFTSYRGQLFTTPEEASLGVQAVNINSISVTRGEMTLADFFTYEREYEFRSNYQPAAAQTWSLRPALERNNNQPVEISLSEEGLTPGLYYVRAESPDVGSAYDPTRTLVVSHLNVLVKLSAAEALAWVTDLRTGAAAPNLPLSVYDFSGNLITTGQTDANGLFRTPLNTPISAAYVVISAPGQEQFGMGASLWGDYTWLDGIPANTSFDSRPSASQSHAYLYSDRPIYRPGDTVYYRGILQREFDGRYTASDQPVTITLSDMNGNELINESFTLSAFGSFSGQANLPADLTPGDYSFQLNTPEQGWVNGGYLNIQVADYRKPELNLSLNFDQPALLSGDSATGQFHAEYFFGAPAANLPIRWDLYATPAWFDLPGYETGDNSDPWLFLSDPAFEYLSRQGEGFTDANGNFSISLPNLNLPRSATLTLQVTATESGGYPVSVRSELPLHPERFYIGVHPSAWFGQAGAPLSFRILTADWQKAPQPQTLTATFKQVFWQRAEGEWGFYQFTPTYEILETKSLNTSATGEADLTFTPPAAGTYALEVRGENALTQTLLWVGGKENAAFPRLPYDILRLTADQQEYQPGQTADIFIPNDLGSPALALLSLERGGIHDLQVVTIPPEGYRLQIPLTDEHAPNIYLSATLLGQGTSFRQGFLNIPVEPSAFTLQVNLQADPPQAKPGETLTLHLTATDRQNQPVQAEFSLAVVDLALLALADPNAPDILPAFYNTQPLGVQTGLTAAIYSMRNINFGGGKGGGGGYDTLTVRENFPDTAYWKADIRTDAQGKAQVSLTLPDNLTTWNIDTRGISQNAQVGQTTVQVITSKDLLIRPQTPRFLVVGDHATLSALLNNNTGQTLQAQASLNATGFSLDAETPAQQPISIPAGGSALVQWRGTAQDAEKIEATFSVTSGKLQDAARPATGDIPVLHYNAPQTFSAAGILTENNLRQTELIALPRSFQPQGGQLHLELAPSLASAVLSALQARPLPETVWSNEQILSHLLPNQALYLALQSAGIENEALKEELQALLKTQAAQLLASQKVDGGWAWSINGDPADPYITAYILYGLEQVRRAAMSDLPLEESIQRGRDYLFSNAEPFTASISLADPYWANLTVYYAYMLHETGGLNNFSYLIDVLYEERERLEPWSQAMLATLLSRYYPGDSRIQTLYSDLQSLALRSATGAHWQSAQTGWMLPGSPLFSTAIVLYSLLEEDPASPLATDAARYLSSQYNPQSGWGSDYETAWVSLALTRYLIARGEYRANFAYSASLNGRSVAEGQAGGEANLTAVHTIIPLSGLALNGANELSLSRGEGAGSLYYRASLQVLRPVESAPPLQKGIEISRSYLACPQTGCATLTSYDLQSENPNVTVRLSLTLPQDAYALTVQDYIPAGSDLLNPTLKTSAKEEQATPLYNPADPIGSQWGWWYFEPARLYADHIEWSAPYLPAGTYTLTYTITPSQPGEYRVLPARAWLTYFPEVQGASAGTVFTIR